MNESILYSNESDFKDIRVKKSLKELKVTVYIYVNNVHISFPWLKHVNQVVKHNMLYLEQFYIG